MTNRINLNQYPWLDDYNPEKDYYRVLHKPGVSVQTRELNTVQSMFKAQIERFADNIFQRGSIVSGVNFQFYSPYPYIKINDLQINGELATPSAYVGALIENPSNGLKAYIVNYADGYEASTPNLKTLYLKYINSGNSGNVSVFEPSDTLTVYEGEKTIWGIEVNAGGSGFSNSDQVIISSALVVNVSSGSFSNSDLIVSPDTGATAYIERVDSESIQGKSILYVRPQDEQLTNTSINVASWSFDLYSTVTNQSNTVSAIIENEYGSGATGVVRTNAAGSIQQIIVTNRGQGYELVPTVSVKTSNLNATVGTIDLEAKNYIAKVTVPATSDAVGEGYGFQVTDGFIYDLGTFCRVGKQTIVVSKYDPNPNNVVVGFETEEEIIDWTKDTTLLDNSNSDENENAPGADRLKLTPKLVVTSVEDARNRKDFLPLVEWNDGNPYIQNKSSTYSRIGDAMAQQIYDHSGNFVLDAFQVTTTFVANTQKDSHYYTVIVDPGQAYINGRKVQTLSNYRVDLSKGTDTATVENRISLAYGNYIRVKELGGTFDVSSGSTVNFYASARRYLTTQFNNPISPIGRHIGSAKIRSFELENGKPGNPETVYRMYLFDIHMNAGESFENIRSVYYNDDYDAIADVVLEYNASLEQNVCEIKDARHNSLLFPAGVESLKGSSNSSYIYRTSQSCNTSITTGQTAISIGSSEYFPYGVNRELSFAELQEFVVTPGNSHLLQESNLDGTIEVSNDSIIITGNSTNFFSDFEAGDYIYIQSGGLDSIRRIEKINNSTSMEIDSPPAFSNTESVFRRIFPQNVPVPFGSRQGLTGTIDATGENVTLHFAHSNGTSLSFTSGSAQVETFVTHNVERRNVSRATKTANRGKYVKVLIANNDGGTEGPWCLGVPDIFRLRAVYRANTIDVNTASQEITSEFYIDHNQNQNYLNHGFLFKKNQTSSVINEGDSLLVCFDYFTNDDSGYFETSSYLRTSNSESIQAIDSSTFEELSANIAASTWEIPELYTVDDKSIDLINQIDFRPSCDPTATPSNEPATAPINPEETVTFTGLSKFPAPRSIMTTQIEHYLGRIDDVYIGESGHIYVLKGVPDINPRRRLQSNHPKDSLRLQMLNVPPYPGLTAVSSIFRDAHINTGVGNEKLIKERGIRHSISPILSTTNLQTSQPMVYTMEDIANLERRIKDLEYYVSLSVLETDMAKREIPSSIDPSLNRFKYGFFADDFTTEVYSDLANPQYSASFEAEGDLSWGSSYNPLESDLSKADKSISNIMQPTKLIQKETFLVVPPKYTWSMKHFTENMFFVDVPILDQFNATQKIHPCVKVSDSTTIGEAYYISVNRRQSQFYTEGLPGIVTLYFHTFGQGSLITVYGPDNEIVATTAISRSDVKTLSASDRTFITTNEHAKDFYEAISSSGLNSTPTRSGAAGFTDYIIGPGKMTFASKPGQYKITVNSLSGFNSSGAKVMVRYPSINSAFGRVINSPACDPTPPLYTGMINPGALTLVTWSCSNQFRANSTNYKSFVVEVTGLKPNTIHKLMIDGEEWTHAVNITDDLFKIAKSYVSPPFKHFMSRWINKPNQGFGSYSSALDMWELEEGLNISMSFQLNQVNVFLGAARGRLYDSNGNRTKHTYLRSNKSGKIRALLFFPAEIAGWWAQDFKAEAYVETIPKAYKSYSAGVAAFKAGVQDQAFNHKNVRLKNLKPTVGSSGYATIQFISEDKTSSAIRVFAARIPGKNIPYDVKGEL